MYISLALKQTIEEFVGKDLNKEELENFIDFNIRKRIQELRGD